MGQFKGNMAHSCRGSGVVIADAYAPQQPVFLEDTQVREGGGPSTPVRLTVGCCGLTAVHLAATPAPARPCAQVYKVYGAGPSSACLWSGALYNLVVDRLVCADFARGLGLQYNTVVRDSVLAAFSNNRGNPGRGRRDEQALKRWGPGCVQLPAFASHQRANQRWHHHHLR
jgi:hypothetical protein